MTEEGPTIAAVAQVPGGPSQPVGAGNPTVPMGNQGGIKDEIDLYGDTGGDEGEGLGGVPSQEDLYDDVLQSSSDRRRDSLEGMVPNGQSSVTSSVSASGGLYSGRRHCLYIGNMTWWTTDKDILDAVTSLGITDLMEVKFFENRANGQSKGFALISFGSENSQRLAQDKLITKEIHEQKLAVMPYTKSSLAHFDAATRKIEPSPRMRDHHHHNGPGGHHGHGPIQPGQKIPMGPGIPKEAQGAKYLGAVRIGTGPPAQRPAQSMMNAAVPHQQIRTASPMAPQIVHRPTMLPPGLPAPQGVRLPPAQVMARPTAPGFPPPGVPGRPPTVPPPVPGAPAPHINPNFQSPTGAQQQMPGGYHNASAPPPGFGTPGAVPQHHPAQHQQAPPQEQISEAEFEEIMNRNKTVSSSAISRAVSDAGVGDYAAAIETLVTAISLIRQSKVAHDDRCRILIASLQDTLRGIEAKSYGRKRSRSRERESRRERKRRERSRSRSRSRDRYRVDDYSPRRHRY